MEECFDFFVVKTEFSNNSTVCTGDAGSLCGDVDDLDDMFKRHKMGNQGELGDQDNLSDLGKIGEIVWLH